MKLAHRYSRAYCIQANKYKSRKLEERVLQFGEKKISVHVMAKKDLFLAIF